MQKNLINISDYYNSENITYELIDVRSPYEYSIDHIPGALNFPALNNLERAEVGKIYNQNSFEAKKIGASAVPQSIVASQPALQWVRILIVLFCFSNI